MAKHVINVSLNEKSIDDAIRELEKYKRDFDRKLELFARKLAQTCMRLEKVNLSMFPAEEWNADTGQTGVNSSGTTIQDILDSIDYKPGEVITNGYVYYVVTGNEFAPYVEFGTGIIGQKNPHEAPTWAYDINKHGESGWVYVDSNGHKQWTKGMRAKPFVFMSVMELSTKVSEIAREVFG